MEAKVVYTKAQPGQRLPILRLAEVAEIEAAIRRLAEGGARGEVAA